MITCVVLDDEPLALQVLEHYISQSNHLRLVASFRNAIAAFEYLGKHPVDLLFLDIEMPLVNGVHFLKVLAKPPKTIFTTAYKQYAFDGFELNVVDYLLKPFSYERFSKAVEKVKGTVSEAGTPSQPLFIKTKGNSIPIHMDDILYVESARDYIIVVTLLQNYWLYHTLKGFFAKLDNKQFLQVHRSFLINRQHINRIQCGKITLSNNASIPIGKSYQQQVHMALHL